MPVSPVLPYTLPELAELIYIKTNIGAWFFDAFLRIDHTSRLKITEHPVQSGAAITDHAYLEPAELVMEIGMSDTARSLVDWQFTANKPRSEIAYQVLMELQAQRVPLQVMTKLKVYKNMLIEVIAAPEDYKTLYGLRTTVTLREIIVAEVKTVQISARPQVTGSTQRGTAEVVQPNQSVLKQVGTLLGR